MSDLSNTERLIKTLENTVSATGQQYIDFYVGKYTGNNPSVVGALRRRGYTVTKSRAFGHYRLFCKES